LNRKVTRNAAPERFTTAGPSRVKAVGDPENAAVTDVAAVIVTVHVAAVPLHAPPQPVNLAPAAGAAVSTTLDPVATSAVQVAPPVPQLIPPPVTLPLPATDTERTTVVGVPPEKDALTLFALLIETVQVVAVPLQAPPQPEKVAPEAGVAVNVTLAPSDWLAVHAVAPLPQLIPPPVTVPGPLTETVSGTFPLENVALTLFDAFIRTVQVVAVPPHAPLQPVKVAPVAGVAVSVTVLLSAKLAEHAVPPRPQLIAPLPPLTLPLPVTETVSCGAATNAAETVWSLLIVMTQVGALPEQAPPQPWKE
jgi:hypothetical protein